jgi:hypothetical protein
MASEKQRAAACRNVKKAAAAAKSQKSIAHLSAKTRSAVGKQASKVANEKRGPSSATRLTSRRRGARFPKDRLDRVAPDAMESSTDGGTSASAAIALQSPTLPKMANDLFRAVAARNQQTWYPLL